MKTIKQTEQTTKTKKKRVKNKMTNDNYKIINFQNRNRFQSEKQRLSSEIAEQKFAPSKDRQIQYLMNSDRQRVRSAKSSNLRFRDNARINYSYLRADPSRFMKKAA